MVRRALGAALVLAGMLALAWQNRQFRRKERRRSAPTGEMIAARLHALEVSDRYGYGVRNPAPQGSTICLTKGETIRNLAPSPERNN